MKVYIVYSCYSESFEDPSIFFEACATIQKAREIFEGFTNNATEQAKNCFESLYYEEETSFEKEYDIEESDTTYVCRETNGDKAWEVYIVEQELLA